MGTLISGSVRCHGHQQSVGAGRRADRHRHRHSVCMMDPDRQLTTSPAHGRAESAVHHGTSVRTTGLFVGRPSAAPASRLRRRSRPSTVQPPPSRLRRTRRRAVPEPHRDWRNAFGERDGERPREPHRLDHHLGDESSHTRVHRHGHRRRDTVVYEYEYDAVTGAHDIPYASFTPTIAANGSFSFPFSNPRTWLMGTSRSMPLHPIPSTL